MKRIMVNLSDEEMAKWGLNEGSGSEDIKRVMSGKGDVGVDINDRLDGMAKVIGRIEKKLDGLIIPSEKVVSPVVDRSVPSSQVRWGDDWLDSITDKTDSEDYNGIEKEDYSDIIERVGKTYGEGYNLDFEEAGELSAAIKDAGLVWNKMRNTLEKLVEGKYIIIKQF